MKLLLLRSSSKHAICECKILGYLYKTKKTGFHQEKISVQSLRVSKPQNNDVRRYKNLISRGCGGQLCVICVCFDIACGGQLCVICVCFDIAWREFRCYATWGSRIVVGVVFALRKIIYCFQKNT